MKASYALRKNLGKLNDALEAFEETRDELVKKISQNGKIDVDRPFNLDGTVNMANVEWNQEIKVLMNATSEFEPHKFSENDLNIGTEPAQNRIPVGILAWMRELFEDQAPQAADQAK